MIPRSLQMVLDQAPSDMQGTPELGYYGTVSQEDFITAAALTSAVRLTTGSLHPATDAFWLKFAYKGKILYVASKAFRRNLGWTELNVRGLINGIDVEILGRTYKCRVLNGSNNVSAVPPGTSSNHASLAGSEFSELLYRVCANSGQAEWANFTNAELGMASNYAAGSASIMREISGSASLTLFRGHNGILAAHKGDLSGQPAARGWRPVLELVE